MIVRVNTGFKCISRLNVYFFQQMALYTTETDLIQNQHYSLHSRSRHCPHAPRRTSVVWNRR